MSALPTREHGLHLLAEMLRIRCFEDRCAELYSCRSPLAWRWENGCEDATASSPASSVRAPLPRASFISP